MNTLEINGFKCQINTPDAIHDKTDKVHSLPPYKISYVYIVDEYTGCPENWMHGSKNASSYFMSVKENSGLWFDFNQNSLEYDIAVVISIQGINPITGQKTDKITLEQYDKCPTHKEEFLQDRFCKSCGYKWPNQNYITTTSTPSGMFWLDGFRNPDGTVRQYIFTKEQLRGVANNLIGEDRTFSIGIAFYKSKKKKERLYLNIGKQLTKPQWINNTKWDSNSPDYDEIKICSSGLDENYTCSNHKLKNNILRSKNLQDNGIVSRECINNLYEKEKYGSASAMSFDQDSKISRDIFEFSDDSIEVSEKFEVGAGAKVNQQVYDDKEELTFYEDKPSGMIYINYACEEDINKILAIGKRKEIKDGFLANIPVGN